jgi:hypothetical protein
MAIKQNIADAISLLRQNLQEEEEMFGWLSKCTYCIYKTVVQIELLLNY